MPPHFKYVAVMSGTLILALTFIDYQFKVILKGELQNEALAGFMGTFYGVSGVLVLLVQFFSCWQAAYPVWRHDSDSGIPSGAASSSIGDGGYR